MLASHFSNRIQLSSVLSFSSVSPLTWPLTLPSCCMCSWRSDFLSREAIILLPNRLGLKALVSNPQRHSVAALGVWKFVFMDVARSYLARTKSNVKGYPMCNSCCDSVESFSARQLLKKTTGACPGKPG